MVSKIGSVPVKGQVNAYDSRLKNWVRRSNAISTKYLGWMRMLECEKNLTPVRVLTISATRFNLHPQG